MRERFEPCRLQHTPCLGHQPPAERAHGLQQHPLPNESSPSLGFKSVLISAPPRCCFVSLFLPFFSVCYFLRVCLTIAVLVVPFQEQNKYKQHQMPSQPCPMGLLGSGGYGRESLGWQGCGRALAPSSPPQMLFWQWWAMCPGSLPRSCGCAALSLGSGSGIPSPTDPIWVPPVQVLWSAQAHRGRSCLLLHTSGSVLGVAALSLSVSFALVQIPVDRGRIRPLHSLPELSCYAVDDK